MDLRRIILLIDDMGQGGAERQMSYLAIVLKRAGHNVRLVKFYPDNNHYNKELELAGIKTEIAECGISKYKRPFFIAKIARQWHPDAVIAYKDGVCMAACIARLFAKFKLIVSERNTTQILSRYERIKFQLYRIADTVVPNSQSQADFISKYATWLRRKLFVITNMIDTDKFCHAKNLCRNAIPHVITVARIAPQKNILTYLEAIAILKEQGLKAHFDWYGHPEHVGYFEKVKNKVSELGINDLIDFHAGTNEIEIKYQEATHFCLPSLYEGFPNVLCEAMATGLVCTASDVCDNPYILTDKKLRFNPLDAKMMAEAIKYSLEFSEDEQRKISRYNHDRIVNLCSPEAFVAQYESLIR